MAITESKNGLVASSGITNVYAHMVPAATTSGTDTFGVVDNSMFVTAINIPCNMTITGISYLIGSVGGTDKAIAALFDSTGAPVAWSAIAGTTVGTTATMQHLAFITAYAASGPGLYFIGIQLNGATAKIRTQPFGDHPAAVFPTLTFGAPAAITPPTTFTASKGPIVMTY